MITSPQNMSAGEAGKYYYETKEHSAEWGGRLAEILNLKGNATQDQFLSLLNGYAPDGRQLAKNAGDPQRRAGADYTFTLAKNLSILATNDSRILDAFKESVKETLDIMEERYAETRTRVNGEQRIIERTGNMLYTLFTHYANRNLDPSVHIHTFIHNYTQDKAGNIKSMEYKDMYANKTYMGALQENILAQKVRALGYELDINRSKAMSDAKLPEALEKLTERFSSRTAEIDKKAAELREKYPSMTEKDLRQLAEKATRARKEHNPTYEETKEYALKRVSAVEAQGLKDLTEKAKTAVIEEKDKLETLNETKRALRMGIKDIEENYRTFKYEKAENVTIKHSGLAADKSAVKTAFKSDKNIVKINNSKYFTTKEILKDIKLNYKTIRKNELSDVNFSSVRINKAVESWQEKNGMTLTASQKAAVDNILYSTNKYNIVQGDAGTGKTKSINLINEFLEKKGYEIIGASHTGKATEVLKDSDIKNIYTIAKLEKLVENQKIEVNEKTVVFIDEASMVSDKQAKFLNSLPAGKIVFIGDDKQYKSIERGEFFKEASKAARESGLKNVYTNMDVAVRFNTDVQKEVASELAARDFAGAFETLKSNGKIVSFAENEDKLKALSEKFNAIKEDYLNAERAGKEALVLVDTNMERNALNSLIRPGRIESGDVVKEGKKFGVYENKVISVENKGFAESYNAGEKVIVDRSGETYDIKDINKENNTLILSGESGDSEFKLTNKNKEDIRAFVKKDIEIAQGDKIVFLKNDKDIAVNNGELATIKSIDEAGNVTAIKENNDAVVFNPTEYKNFDYGYALTTYKSQGETVNTAIYAVNDRFTENFEEKFYVAGTRATDEVKIYGTDKELEIFKENIKHSKDISIFKENLSESVLDLAMNSEIEEMTTQEQTLQEQEQDQEITREIEQQQEQQHY